MARRLLVVYFVYLLGWLVIPVGADEGTWHLGGGGEWHQPESWVGTVPDGPGDRALFSSDYPGTDAIISIERATTLGTLEIASPHHLTIEAAFPLTFDMPGTSDAASLILGPGTGGLDLEAELRFIDDARLRVLALDPTSRLRLNGSFGASSVNLLKEGGGRLILRGDNRDWTGAIAIQAGTLVAATNRALGSGSAGAAEATTVYAPGALLMGTGVAIATERIILEGGQLSGPALGAASLGGPIELRRDSAIVNGSKDGMLHLTAPISGTAGLQFRTGTLRIDAPTTFAGLLQVHDGTVDLRATGEHHGTAVHAGGLLIIRQIGSLVDAGTVIVNRGAQLRLVEPAGLDPSRHSVEPDGIRLNGGLVRVATNIDLARLLAPDSTGGVLALEGIGRFDGGGTGTIDFNAIGGQDLRLGAMVDSAVPSAVALVPDAMTDTFHFGGGPAKLVVDAVIEDVVGAPTHVEQGVSGITVLKAPNTYTGQTLVNGGELRSVDAMALGAPDVGTTIHSGTLRLLRSGSEPLVVEAGTLLLDDEATDHRGAVLMRGGTLGTQTSGAGAGLAGLLSLADGAVATMEAPEGKTLALKGGSAGTGDLRLGGPGTISVEGPGLRHQGAVLVQDGTFELRAPGSFDGPLQVNGGTASVRAFSDHRDSEVNAGGLLAIRQIGSLVNAGPVTVHGGGELRIVKPPGSDPERNSVGFESVVLDGGLVSVAANMDLARLFSPASTGGVLALEGLDAFDGGGTGIVDFEAMGGRQVRLGAKEDSKISSIVAMMPDALTGTLRFGGGSASLVVAAVVQDTASGSTHVEQAASGVTVLKAPNTYTGHTLISGGELRAVHAMALGAADVGTTVRQGTLEVQIAGEEPITLEGGTLLLNDAAQVHSGAVTMRTGTLSTEAARARLGGPLVLADGGVGTVIAPTGKVLVLKGGSTGRGDLRFPAAGVISAVDVGFGHEGAVLVEAGTFESNATHTFTGPLVLGQATAKILAPSAHGGSVVQAGGLMAIAGSGSLVQAGVMTVNVGGALQLFEPAGIEPEVNSVMPHGVVLDGGAVRLAANVDPAGLLSPLSRGGLLALEGVGAFDAGGSRLLDFNLVGGGAEVRLGAQADSTILLGTSMVPDTVTDTFHFGGGPAKLIVNAMVEDVGGAPTHVEQGVSGITVLKAPNTYTGQTLVNGGELRAVHASALGSPDVGTIVRGGTLRLLRAGSEPAIVEAGTVLLDDATVVHRGTLTMRGGTLSTQTAGSSAGLAGALILADGATATVEAPRGKTLALTGGTEGLGDLRLDGAGTVSVQAIGFGHHGAVLIQDGTFDLRAPSSFGGPLQVNGGTANVRAFSEYGGSVVNAGGLLAVRQIGSLVNAGPVTVRGGGELRIVEPAGSDPERNSVGYESVVLDGGLVSVAANIDLARLFSPASTGGVLTLERLDAFDGGGTGIIDFEAIGGRDLRLAASGSSTVSEAVSLLPDATTATLRLGGDAGVLTVMGTIQDRASASPTAVEQVGAGRTDLRAANLYTGPTLLNGGTLEVNHPGALGDPTVGTMVRGGVLTFYRSSDEPVTNDGGTVNLEPGINAHTGPIDLLSGTLNAERVMSGPLRVGGGTAHIHRADPSSGPISITGGLVKLHDGSQPFGGVLTMGGGELRAESPGNTVVVTGPLVLADGASALVSTPNRVRLEGGSAGWGDLVLRTSGLIDITGTPLAHDGDLTLDVDGQFGRVMLSSANRYSGATYVSGTEVVAANATALGDTAAGTTVERGHLRLTMPSDEPLTAGLGGVISVNASSYPGPIRLRNGHLDNLDPNSRGVSTRVLAPLELLGGVSLVSGRESLVLEQGIVGAGDLVFSGNSINSYFRIDGPVSQVGDLVVRFGEVQVHAPTTLNGSLVLDSGTAFGGYFGGKIKLMEDVTAALRLYGGTVSIADTKTLTSLAPTLRMAGGEIDGRLDGVAQIVKDSFRKGGLAGLGPDSDVAISVEKGILVVWDGTGLGSATQITTVAPRDAVLKLRTVEPIAEPIMLENATGFFHSGALQTINMSPPPVLTGPVDLGAVGSIIGFAESAVLDIRGPVSGGHLTLVNPENTALRLTGNRNTFSGTARLAGTLVLADEGALTTTQGVVVESGGLLHLDNSAATRPDRVHDQIPLALVGGSLMLSGNYDRDAHVTETLGPVTVGRGGSMVSTRSLDSRSVALTFDSLSRDPGGAVTFAAPIGVPDPSPDPRDATVFIRDPPPLTGGIIGGWAWGQGRPPRSLDFVTYTPERGIEPLSATGRPTRLDGAGPTDNVRLTGNPPTLDADTTINSLLIETGGASSAALPIDLGGHTLNLQTGGLIAVGPRAPVITGGSLTAGGSDGDAELILGAADDVPSFTIEADVVDGPAGPLGLTLAGEGTVILSGTNTYSGPTTVNRSPGGSGQLRITRPAALPADADVVINGGDLRMEFTATVPVDLGTVVLRDRGGISAPMIDADRYLVESGNIGTLVGDSPLIKTGIGTARANGSNYRGDIQISEGTIEVKTQNASVNPLGSGTITVDPDGTLALLEGRTTLFNPVVLAGGGLAFRRGTVSWPVVLAGDLHVLSDSTMYVGIAARLDGKLSGDGDLVLANLNDPVAPARLHLHGDNRAYRGDLTFEDVILTTYGQDSLGQGVTTVGHGGVLEAGTPRVAGHIALADGEVTAVDRATTFSGRLDVHGQNASVSSDNDITVSGVLVLNDGARLNKSASGALVVTGDILVGQDTSVRSLEGQVRLRGRVLTDSANASLDIRALNTDALDVSLEVGSGQSLAVYRDGELEPLVLQGSRRFVAGSGTLLGDLTIRAAAQLRPGASVGMFTAGHDMTWGPGGHYEWEINHAFGGAGGTQGHGWDLLAVEGSLRTTATAADPFVIEMLGLDETGAPGAVPHFDPSRNFTWLVAASDPTSAVDLDGLQIDASDFVRHNPLAPLGAFSLSLGGRGLWLSYVAPEPGTIAALLGGALLIALNRPNRRTPPQRDPAPAAAAR